MTMKKTRWFSLLLAIVFLTGLSAPASGGPPVGASERVDVLIGFHGPPHRGLVERFSGEISREFTLVDVIAARVPSAAVEALARHPAVRYVEMDLPVYALEMATASATDQVVPWGVDRIFGDEEHRFVTWAHSTGNEVGVAVLDTGIDENHEDLDLKGGTTTVDKTHWGSDGSGHGTHVAGTIAALDNQLGVVGVAPSVELYAVKVLDDSGGGTVSSVVAGIQWATDEKIRVINMSLGSGSHSQTLEDACNAAYGLGHLLVAAAGNSGMANARFNNVSYPARYASVIAVAAVDQSGNRPRWSSTGPAVELAAPGAGVISTIPGDGYASYSGTSMASPHVAGAAALVWAADSSLTQVEVRAILGQTAEVLTGLTGSEQGQGLVRADRAVASLEIDPADPGPPEEPVVGSIVVTGPDSITVPSDGEDPVTVTYSAEVLDAEGGTMDDEVVTWSLTGWDGAGVTIDAESGQVEVSSNAGSGESFMVRATSECGVIGEREVTLVASSEEPTGQVNVHALDCYFSGGRLQNRHLHVVVELHDDLGSGVAGAQVTMQIWRDTEHFYAEASGTTGTNGRVIFDFNNFINAPSGEYEVKVTSVIAEPLEWNGKHPDCTFNHP